MLQRIKKKFNHPFDFLDGDKNFRKIHNMVDIFVDSGKQLSALVHLINPQEPTILSIQTKLSKVTVPNDYIDPGRFLPPVYDFRNANRSPVLQLGYGLFKKSKEAYFAGNHLGYNGIRFEEFLGHWWKIKHLIDTPFVLLCQGNENWGCLSTFFPNRTASWGNCCGTNKYALLDEFLNHDKTLMIIINQHHNLTHPKILTLPRGIPISWTHTESMILDTMKYALTNIKKTGLLFASGSTWGPSKHSYYIMICKMLNEMKPNRTPNIEMHLPKYET